MKGQDEEHPEVDGVNEKIMHLMEYAAQLGLHGVFILSPPCPGCGMLHQFRLLTDIPQSHNDENNVAQLLRQMADYTESNNPSWVPKGERKQTQ